MWDIPDTVSLAIFPEEVASPSALRLPGKSVSFSLCDVSYTAPDGIAANTAELDSEVDMAHQGSLLWKACSAVTLQLLWWRLDSSWYKHIFISCAILKKSGRLRRQENRHSNVCTSKQTVTILRTAEGNTAAISVIQGMCPPSSQQFCFLGCQHCIG